MNFQNPDKHCIKHFSLHVGVDYVTFRSSYFGSSRMHLQSMNWSGEARLFLLFSVYFYLAPNTGDEDGVHPLVEEEFQMKKLFFHLMNVIGCAMCCTLLRRNKFSIHTSVENAGTSL